MTWQLVSRKDYALPIYLYAIALTAVASLIYSAASLIPGIEDFYGLINLITAFLALSLLGKSFWMLVIRHVLTKIGFSRFAPRSSKKLEKLANHLRPSFNDSNLGLTVLRYFAAISNALIFFIAKAESEVMSEVERHTGRAKHEKGYKAQER